MLIEVSGLGDLKKNIQSVILELRIFCHLKYSRGNDSFGKGVVNLFTLSVEASFSRAAVTSDRTIYLHLYASQRHSC